MKQRVDWGKNNRIILHEVLPLDTPFSIIIGVSSICNFKCNYCIHSLSNKELRKINFNLNIMNYNLYTKIIDDTNKFPNKIKSLQFLKDGEQLINRRLPEMIKYAKQSNKFEKIELITNGVLLTEDLNLQLINARLDTIRISLQGLNKKKYHEISKVDIDFDKFISIIKHFYDNSKINNKNCKVHLKMINIGIDNEKDMEIFNDICDEYSIQYVIPYFTNVNYNNKYDNDLYGNKSKTVNICSRPFMSLYISSDGNIMPCCREDNKNLIIGNIKNESLYNIWNGKLLKNFRILQLKNKRFEHVICKDCCLPDTITTNEDNLDNHSKKLLTKYGEK